MIFTFIAIATLLTAVGSLLMTSRYTATAEVLVADHPATGLDLSAAMQGMPPDVAHMSSQVEVIRSRNLASSVIDKLGLALDPEFKAALQPRSMIRRLLDELPLACSRRAESEARLSQMRNLTRSQLSEEYGSRHPVLINAKAELQDLRAKIDTEVKRIVQSLQANPPRSGACQSDLRRSVSAGVGD